MEYKAKNKNLIWYGLKEAILIEDYKLTHTEIFYYRYLYKWAKKQNKAVTFNVKKIGVETYISEGQSKRIMSKLIKFKN